MKLIFHNCYYEKIGNNKPVKLEDLPFDIPDNWTWIRLKDISYLYGGYAFKSEKFSKEGIRVIRISDFDEKGIKNNDIKRYPYSIELNNSEIFKNDIIMCMTGGTVGKSLLIKNLIERTFINQRIALIRIDQGNYLYLNIVIISSYINNIINKSKTSTNDNISMKLIENFLIPFPPIQEQKRIVDKINFLEPLFEKYKNLEKKLTNLEKEFPEKLKKAILQYAIEGKLVKQDPNDEPASVLLERIKMEKEKLIKEGKIKRDNNESYIYKGDDKNYYEKINRKNTSSNEINEYLFHLPESWKWCSISQISKQITDGTHKTPHYVSSGVPFISISNISSGSYDNNPKYITEEEHAILTSRCCPSLNDILICRIGTLGKPYIIDMDFEFSIFVSLGLIKLIDVEQVYYIKFVLESPFIGRFIDFVKVGGGTHTFKINVQDLNRFPIPLPPKNESFRIVNKLNLVLSLIYQI